MKSILLFALTMLFSMARVFAVSDSTTKFINLYVGAYVAGKVGLNTKVADGFKSDVNLNTVPDFGATFLLNFGKNNNIGFGLDAGYSTLSYISKPDVNIQPVTDDNIVKEQYSYVGIFPHLSFSGFIVGCNIGFPSSGTTKTKSGKDFSVLVPGTIIPAPVAYEGFLNTLYELKLGGRFPVSDDDLGRLNVEVMASYALNHIYLDAKNYYGSYNNNGVGTIIFNADDNPMPVALSIGFSYQFKLGIAVGH